MKTQYVIRDLYTNEYYWNSMLDEGFSENIGQATLFESEEDALKELGNGYLNYLFSKRLLEIVKIYTIYVD